jgi:methenyltetrahydromethanopterin cyclohydrolase
MISINQRATSIVQQMIGDCEALGLSLKRLKNDADVIDAGIDVSGSMEAGRLFSSACMGGLGQIHFTQQLFKAEGFEFWLPAVAVTVSCPHIACMASQYAGWAVQYDRYSAIGSGPARALYAGEEIYNKLDYRDQAKTAVLMLEGRQLPGEDVAAFVAEKCKIKPGQLTLLIAPTASLVGSIQIAARSAETGLHKLSELGFDVRQVASAYGVCPLAPVALDDLHAMGRTNDAILYGAQAFYSVHSEDDVLAQLVEKVPSSSSRDYGTLFIELFQRYNGDFYQIDPLLFSPAQVEIHNLKSGRTFVAGGLNPSLLRKSLLEI